MLTMRHALSTDSNVTRRSISASHAAAQARAAKLPSLLLRLQMPMRGGGLPRTPPQVTMAQEPQTVVTLNSPMGFAPDYLMETGATVQDNERPIDNVSLAEEEEVRMLTLLHKQGLPMPMLGQKPSYADQARYFRQRDFTSMTHLRPLRYRNPIPSTKTERQASSQQNGANG